MFFVSVELVCLFGCSLLFNRGPTDLLQALESTLVPDLTRPHYFFVDDHFLSPFTYNEKRFNALSKISGRNAARYFFEKYPQYFHRDISEPKIEAFSYRDVFDETMEFEIADLERSISSTEVKNAEICYETLLKQGVTIERDMLDDLLELACFFNSENPTQPELVEIL